MGQPRGASFAAFLGAPVETGVCKSCGMTLSWTPPSCPGAAAFAQWDGFTFALVRAMPGGKWRAAVFPDGQSEHSRDGLAGSEAKARLYVERWARHHWPTIRIAAPRTPMPHEGRLQPRKPKGIEDRS